MTCHNCGQAGHIRPRCPKNTRAFKDATTTTIPYKVRFCLEGHKLPNISVTGTINGFWSSSIIRDTGCSGVVVSEEALPDIDPSLCPKVQVADYLGRINEFPVVKCYLQCPFYTDWTDAVRVPIKFASALVGNIPGVQDPDGPDSLLSNDNHSLHSNHDQAITDVSSLQDPQDRLLMTLLRPEPPSSLKTRTTSLLDVSIYHQLSPPLLKCVLCRPESVDLNGSTL